MFLYQTIILINYSYPQQNAHATMGSKPSFRPMKRIESCTKEGHFLGFQTRLPTIGSNCLQPAKNHTSRLFQSAFLPTLNLEPTRQR